MSPLEMLPYDLEREGGASHSNCSPNEIWTRLRASIRNNTTELRMRLWAPVATGRIVRIELKPQVCGAGAKSRPLTAVLVPVFDKLALFPEATVALGVTTGGGGSVRVWNSGF